MLVNRGICDQFLQRDLQIDTHLLAQRLVQRASGCSATQVRDVATVAVELTPAWPPDWPPMKWRTGPFSTMRWACPCPRPRSLALENSKIEHVRSRFAFNVPNNDLQPTSFWLAIFDKQFRLAAALDENAIVRRRMRCSERQAQLRHPVAIDHCDTAARKVARACHAG